MASQPEGAHRPSSATSVPAERALQALQYSTPSQPHTPGQSRGQPPIGPGLHVPPPQVPSGISQYSPSAQGCDGPHSGAQVTSGQLGPGSQVIAPAQPGQQSSPDAQDAAPHARPASSRGPPASPSEPASTHSSVVQLPPGAVQIPQLALQHTSPTPHVTAPQGAPRAPSLPASSPPPPVPPHAIASAAIALTHRVCVTLMEPSVPAAGAHRTALRPFEALCDPPRPSRVNALDALEAPTWLDPHRFESDPARGISSRMRLALRALCVLGLSLPSGCSCDGDLGGPRDGSLPGDSNVGPGSDIVIVAPGAPADAADRFGDPAVTDAARAAAIVYPLDGVLFPLEVSSPDVQWEGPGAEGDLYRVRFEGAPISLTAYVAHTGAGFTDDYLVDFDAWRRLSAAAAGREMSLTVDRWDSARREVILGAPVRVRMARGSITGAVYYWTLGSFSGTEGRIVRVRQGTPEPPRIENFMPQPPPGAGGDRCAACHGLSRDGNHLAVSLDDGNFGAVFDLTTDLSGADPPSIFTFDRPWFFAAFDPTGARVLMTDASQQTFLLDGASGAEITPASGALPSATHPAWAPDGSQIAMIVGADDAWNPTTGDLAVAAVTGADAFGAVTTLHVGSALASAPEGGALDAYPSYSPDSRVIAFSHGTRTLPTAGGAASALYAIGSGGGAPVRLDNASAGGAWYPSFTPFVTPADDGSSVYWLLHYSPRDYGNALAGTRGTGRRQIWVSAIRVDASGGVDPSHVPYWLPGQAVGEENASAAWAPIPCRPNGSGCAEGDDCCSGFCDMGSGPPECAPPPESMCRRAGQTCSSTSDCCEGGDLVCAGGACVVAPI